VKMWIVDESNFFFFPQIHFLAILIKQCGRKCNQHFIFLTLTHPREVCHGWDDCLFCWIKFGAVGWRTYYRRVNDLLIKFISINNFYVFDFVKRCSVCLI
jgi:hypothetical protein